MSVSIRIYTYRKIYMENMYTRCVRMNVLCHKHEVMLREGSHG
jgi:hypothetical protein